MGIYLNPRPDGFKESIHSEIYVDKTGLIAATNAVVNTQQKFVCISRPRRFGKTMSAKMLAAYYGKCGDTSALFDDLTIASHESYRKHLNQYNVISINMQQFLSKTKNVDELLALLQKKIIRELQKEFPGVVDEDERYLSMALDEIYVEENEQFIFIIDEWDCILREKPHHTDERKQYLDFLRDLLKDQPYVALAYMTGILPIKKYGTHSALNMFDEFSMLEPGVFAPYLGFTQDEVRSLCEEYSLSYEDMASWYDGYALEYKTIKSKIVEGQCKKEHIAHRVDMYNPKSVVRALLTGNFSSYWTQTETYDALKVYIDMDMEGLHGDIAKLLADQPVVIEPGRFQNDMTTFASKDDVLTLLVHLGYLSYNQTNKTVIIPNYEIRGEFVRAINGKDYKPVSDAIKESDQLLAATIEGDTEAVCAGLSKAHMENASILKYNDENSLRCVIKLAYYTARNDYTIVDEMPAGKGYADLAFIPKPGSNKPAMIIELKYALTAQDAINQIKAKAYPAALEHYQGDLLLVGVSYDNNKNYDCLIEKM